MLQYRDLNLVWTPHIYRIYTAAAIPLPLSYEFLVRDIPKELKLVSLLLQRAYVMFLRQ